MAGRVEGKVAFVTGAARGQGRAHAVRLAEEGASIVALDVCAEVPHGTTQYAPATKADLDETVRLVEAAGGEVLAGVADTRDLEAVTELADAGAERFGKIDVVVANAGVCTIAGWDQITPEVFQTTLDVNVVGTWNTIRACIPHLIRNGGGSIVMVSSAAGLKGLPFLTPYVASKHAITGMARGLANELGEHAIRVNSVHPGAVDTAMAGGADAFGALLEAHPAVGGSLQSALPDALSDARDQAHAVLFLASDESRFATAGALAVDAGNSRF